MAFPSGWLRKQKITLDHTKMGGDESNFPVLLVWTGSATTSNVYPEIVDTSTGRSAKSDGSDIRASSDAGGATQLPVEVVLITTSATKATARLEVYVKLSSVSSASDTVFYIWYGDATATAPAVTDTYGRNAVWTDHIGVYHMTGSGDVADSTGNDRTAVNTSTSSSTGLYNAASARTFADGQFFTISGLMGTPAASTIFGLISCTDVDTTGSKVITIGDYNMVSCGMGYANSAVEWRVSGTWYAASQATVLVDAGWKTLAGSLSPATSHEICYVDASAGADYASATALDYTGQGSDTFIGKHGNGSSDWQYFGAIEEVRILNVYKTATWHTSTYNATYSPQTFVKTSTTFGTRGACLNFQDPCIM